MSRRATVIFVVSEYGEFFSLIDLADRLKIYCFVHPVFLFKAEYGALELHRQVVEERGFSWASERGREEFFDAREVSEVADDYLPTSAPVTAASHSGLRRLGRRSPRWRRRELQAAEFAVGVALLPVYIFSWLVRPLRRNVFARFRRYTLRDRIGIVESLFKRFLPKLVICGQEYPLSTASVASMVGKEFGVETVIVPFSMTPTTKEVAETFFYLNINRINRGFKFSLINRYFPQWIQYYRGRYYTRVSPREILQAEAYGLAPPQPWLPNSGRGIILAPSQQSVDYCRAAGIPALQLKLTGALWNDRLFESSATRGERRAAFDKAILDAMEYRRPNTNKKAADKKATNRTVIVSWPPNQWPRAVQGYPTFEAFSEALADAFAFIMHKQYAKIAVSLHPTLVGTPISENIRKSGLYIIESDLVDVLDCADIFVATVSSTLLWSLQLGIPSINFDPYRYRYREFIQAGMIEAASIKQLRENLIDLLSDNAAFQKVRADMLSKRDYWTLNDGHSFERILGEMQVLCSELNVRSEIPD